MMLWSDSWLIWFSCMLSSSVHRCFLCMTTRRRLGFHPKDKISEIAQIYIQFIIFHNISVTTTVKSKGTSRFKNHTSTKKHLTNLPFAVPTQKSWRTTAENLLICPFYSLPLPPFPIPTSSSLFRPSNIPTSQNSNTLFKNHTATSPENAAQPTD
jgi:hypothetical protein